jgi:hypothetical protein
MGDCLDSSIVTHTRFYLQKVAKLKGEDIPPPVQPSSSFPQSCFEAAYSSV